MIYKNCSKCKESKVITEYNKDLSRKDGHSYLCRDCQNKQTRQSYLKHRDRARATQKKYERTKRKEANYRIKYNISRRIRKALKGFAKKNTTLEYTGCSIGKLKGYLQKTAIRNGYKDFDIESYNGNEYHIDHIKPCRAFDLTKEEEQKKCFHCSNLQILDSKANIVKGGHI